ncbi:uncharacterized protein LOC131891970 [Tigriopus californicus]|uniref:uncharacterized protein LOC131891970 n=1 Tax=Tigriopus californicus TaxID=6832 RepID=UPI0027DA6CA4|nr:uncharacterized protein LOC131891970 [Tigriopus californicus]
MKSMITLTFFLVFCSVMMTTTATRPCHRYGRSCPRAINKILGIYRKGDNKISSMKKCETYCRSKKAQYVVFAARICYCFETCKRPVRVRSKRVVVMFPLHNDPNRVCRGH